MQSSYYSKLSKANLKVRQEIQWILPPNRSNGLCLFFCLYPSCMRNTIPWGQVWNLLYSKEFIYRNKYVKVRDDASLFFRFITPASVLDIGDDVDLIHIQMEDSSPDPGGNKTIKFNIYLKKMLLDNRLQQECKQISWFLAFFKLIFSEFIWQHLFSRHY